MAATGYRARHRYARITARKARIVADMIRGEGVNRALEILEFSPQRAASMYLRVLRSAVANASQDEGVNVNRMVISDCRADDGPLLQGRMRWRPGPQGRAMPFRKRTSHLTVVVEERIEEAASSRAARAPEAAVQPEPSAAEVPGTPEPETVEAETIEAVTTESKTTESDSGPAVDVDQPAAADDATTEQDEKESS